MSETALLVGALLIGIATLIGWIAWKLPEWSRRSIFFAVTVSPLFRTEPAAARIQSRYRIQALAIVGLGLALLVAGLWSDLPLALIVGELCVVTGPIVAFVIAREAVLPHSAKPTLIREAVLAPRAAHLPGGWLLQSGPFAILVATTFYLNAHWDEIPERFPVHWGLDGQPNGWSTRTPMGVYGSLLLGAVIMAGVALTAYGALRHARVVRMPDTGTVHRDVPHQAGNFLLAVEFFLATCFSGVALLPLTGNFGAVPILIVTILLIAALFPLTHWLNAKRAPVADKPSHEFVGDGTLDEHWKLGLFYFNPDDSALLVEKRVGIGWTLNFARGLSWVIMLLVLVLPLSFVFVILPRH